METSRYAQTPQARTRLTLQRGSFYYGMGYALLAGLLAVVGVGLLGVTSLGLLSSSTAFAMTGLAILVVSVVSFVTLVTLRRTLGLLSHHETALVEQAQQHADLAAQVHSQWKAEQIIRDRDQDAGLAALSARQDSSVLAVRTWAERGRVARAGGRPLQPPSDPFARGQVHAVRRVEGVGEYYGRRLNDMGIEDTKQLWNADATYVGGALKVAPSAIAGWQNMAELMAIEGIDARQAELLVRADVSSIDGLCAETPQPLLNRIHRLERHQGSRIQHKTIGITTIQGWIAAAQVHHGLAPTTNRAGPGSGPA